MITNRGKAAWAAAALVLATATGCEMPAETSAEQADAPEQATESPTEEPTSSDSETSEAPEDDSTTPSMEPSKAQQSKPSPLPAPVRCQNRKSNQGEIFVRDTYGADEPPTAMRLGAGWVWDFGEEECITSIEFALRANPGLPGYCTEVGLVRENRGYPVDQRPAPPLPRPIGFAGDC
ncbi:hypothetical protein [Nocardioides pakistanensis]